MSTNKKLIGIVGGIGPYAGIDLVKKIFDQTSAKSDQDHLPVSMLSMPHKICDRTAFIVGETSVNPAIALAEVICDLEKQGASIIGMPCNTAHSDVIFKEVQKNISPEIKLVHMIEEVAKYIKKEFSAIKNVGILSTTGTKVSNVYKDCLDRFDLNTIQVDDDIQSNDVHPAIYDTSYGIKSFSNPVTEEARNGLMKGLDNLINKGAEVVVLGCTEIPLAFPENNLKKIPLIDATLILARALIMEVSPESLIENYK